MAYSVPTIKVNMKKLLAILPLFILFFAVGCNSDSTSPGSGNPVVTGTYSPLTTGSWWKYQTDTNTYTMVIGPSATINGKTYTSLYDQTDSTSGTVLRNEGITTYTITTDSTFTVKEVIYYTQTTGAKWSYDGPSFFGVVTKINGETIEGGLSRTVFGNSYTNVMHTRIKTTVTAFGFSTTTTSDHYYAKDIGRIETLIEGVSTDRLVEYTVK
jgi:hypothetical protein